MCFFYTFDFFLAIYIIFLILFTVSSHIYEYIWRIKTSVFQIWEHNFPMPVQISFPIILFFAYGNWQSYSSTREKNSLNKILLSFSSMSSDIIINFILASNYLGKAPKNHFFHHAKKIWQACQKNCTIFALTLKSEEEKSWQKSLSKTYGAPRL